VPELLANPATNVPGVIANSKSGDVTLGRAIIRNNTSEIHGGFGTSFPVRLGDGEVSLTTGSRDNIIQFQSADDGNDFVDITLLSADNTITAGKGNDRVFSGVCDDAINGGMGFDSVFRATVMTSCSVADVETRKKVEF